MPAKRKVRRTVKRKTRRRGAGFWDGVKSGLNWIKSNKVISTVGNALAPVLPIAGTIGNMASAAGWGKPKRKRARGGAWRSLLSKGHNFIKANQLVSKGLAHFGHPKLASIASAAGYGLKRKRKTRKRGGGMLNYFTTEQPSAIRFN